MILVVGDVMTDVIVRPEGVPAPGTDRRAAIVRRPGGSAGNIACWLGHCGIPTRFAGRVGAADVETHLAAFRRHAVAAHLAADPARETGSVVALLDPDGGRSFYTDRASNLGLGADDLPPSLLRGVRALHVSGHVFFAPGPRAAARGLMAAARAAGIAVSVDAGSAGWLAEAGADSFRDWTAAAGLCFANADEAALLGADGWDVFVTTHGRDGAQARCGGQTWRTPARRAAIEDGTGAGDAFAAGFLAERSRGAAVPVCLAAGADLAAICVTIPGGRPPT